MSLYVNGRATIRQPRLQSKFEATLDYLMRPWFLVFKSNYVSKYYCQVPPVINLLYP